MKDSIVEVCSIGKPGATTVVMSSPLERCDSLPIALVDDHNYEQPMYSVSRNADTFANLCVIGNPGSFTEVQFSPLNRCDFIYVGRIDDPDYIQPVYNPTVDADTFEVLCRFGDVGMSVSAIIDVLNNCGYVDVGKIIKDELGDINPEIPIGSMYVVHNKVTVVFGNKVVVFTKGK